MRALKGLFLLIIANLAVFLTLAITGNLLIHFVLPAIGIDLRGSIATYDFAWAMVFGFGGAFISLLFSKQFARSMYPMQPVIEPKTEKEFLVYNTVKELSARVGIRMPEVWVYWADEPNAFATGPSRNNAMVAVSSGLVENLSDDEVRAVLAHEIGHIANGDMVATTLLQGLMNTFVYFLSTFIARIAASATSRDEEPNWLVYFLVQTVLQILFSVLATIVVMWHSRRREFAADRFAAEMVGAEPMIRALAKIDAIARALPAPEAAEPDALATLKIHASESRIARLFMSHPPIEERIAALRALQAQGRVR